MAAELEIVRDVLGSLSTNCYYVYNKSTKETLIIDPADNFSRIKKRVEELELKVSAVLLTHGHYDHFLAAKETAEFYGVQIYAGELEKDILENTQYNLSAYFHHGCTLKADRFIKDNEILDLIGCQIKAIHAPGHTKGSICYYFMENGFVISGDVLFNCSVGRVDFPTGSAGELIRSIKERLYVLPKETVVLPGHGDETTIGYEIEHNIALG